MKASDLFVKCLEEEKVEYIFGIPGEENLDFLDSLSKSNIKLILTRNEQTAAFMAANYGRFTGKPGVALSTLGPGATNLVTGVAYAQLNGLPLVVITGQKPIKKSEQGEFQIIDVISLMSPICKQSKQIKGPRRIPSCIRQAFKLAASERPGAVHLELPEDIAKEDVTEVKPIHQEEIRRPVVEDYALCQLKDALLAAQQPIILIGAGANRKLISESLTEFIIKYDIPFFESQMGKGVVDETLKQYVGTAAVSDGDNVHKIISKADLIIAIGHDTLEKPTNFISETESKTKLVHINFYEAPIDEVYRPDIEIIGDIGDLFSRLCSEDLNPNWDHSEMYQLKNHFSVNDTSLNETEISDTALVSIVREKLNPEDIVALDNGWYKIAFARSFTTYKPNTLLLDNTFATMGAGVASGMSAKMLNPNKQVVVVTGDGGLVMNLGDLETATRLNLDIVVIVVNNRSYGMIKVKQKAGALSNYGLDFNNPNFKKLAESFGATGFTVNHSKEFPEILDRALKTKGLSIIDLPLKY